MKCPFISKPRVTPRDDISYVISRDAIKLTQNVLLDYAFQTLPGEGMVYWGGVWENHTTKISLVIAPTILSRQRNYEIPRDGIVKAVRAFVRNRAVLMAKIHSHPGSMVDHSWYDDEYTGFKSEGLLSIVVPNYGRNGLLPLTSCGVHRFTSDRFHRLSDRYVLNHFTMVENELCSFEDLR